MSDQNQWGTAADARLTVGASPYHLEFYIGVNVLKYAAERSPHWWQSSAGKRRPRVVDAEQFARAVADALTLEDEIGSTPLTRMLDQMIARVVDGTLGDDDDGVEWVANE